MHRGAKLYLQISINNYSMPIKSINKSWVSRYQLVRIVPRFCSFLFLFYKIHIDSPIKKNSKKQM